jgi:hypothetical protein
MKRRAFHGKDEVKEKNRNNIKEKDKVFFSCPNSHQRGDGTIHSNAPLLCVNSNTWKDERYFL